MLHPGLAIHCLSCIMPRPQLHSQPIILSVYFAGDNCSALADPAGGGDQTCYTQGWPFTACHASCPAHNYTLSQSAPVYYTCGPMGRWDGYEDDDCPFQYPPCGGTCNENVLYLCIQNVRVKNFCGTSEAKRHVWFTLFAFVYQSFFCLVCHTLVLDNFCWTLI